MESKVKQNVCKNLHATKIAPQELISELKALLNDYFVGTFTQEGQSLTLSFFNGQNFNLNIKEIV